MLNPADADFLNRLPQDLLRPAQAADLEEPRGRWIGQGHAVAVPRTVADVASLLAACNTVEGLGKDVKTGGQVITNEAQQTRDTM